MTTKARYDVIDPATTGVYGSICYYEGVKGWLFISMVSSHGGGRTPRDTPQEAMPAWAKKRGAILEGRA